MRIEINPLHNKNVHPFFKGGFVNNRVLSH